ncbi:MAG TPA: AmmeMemoRadiSam system protein B, partial [Gemmataceae bacterium]|nr:AmmeMemoRadiSam system protein B [Gemmataceae bacterium]
EVGKKEGLRYVYAGNLPGGVGDTENTRCPGCGKVVIERYGYLVRSYRLTPDGRCQSCNTALPGVWPRSSAEVKTGNDQTAYLSRLPRRVEGGKEQSLPPTVVHDRRQGLPIVHESPTHEGATTMAAPTSVKSQPSASQAEFKKPTLDAKQQRQLLTAVSGLLCNLVVGEPANFPADLTEIGNKQVWGAFVSLKRGKHLRACSGMMGQVVPLSQAVAHAAERSVWEDERFPPVSPSELPHLQMEVWLLFNPQPVQARGEDRAAAIKLGKHGIQVARGMARALFLPSVAPENNWDAHTFLDRVCMKAGLPATAWKEDDTALFTFDGEAFHSPLNELSDSELAPPRGLCSVEDLPGLIDLCRANLLDLLRGASPRYFIGAPDGMVTGAILTLEQTGVAEPTIFSRLSLRPGVPLHATLLGLVQSAAQYLASQRITQEAFDALSLGLTLLHDPMLHGTVADPQLGGFEPRHRSVLVLERNKAGLAFNPSRGPEELLREAAIHARVGQPEIAGVFSLSTISNVNQVNLSTAPKPVRGPAVRPAAMAGRFYEADPVKLAQTVDELLAGERKPESWPAAMVPHAGLQYSGRIAADVLKRLQIPKTVIIIGPSHTGQGMEWAVAPHQTWSLPGIEIGSDFMLARRLCQAIPGLEMDSVAHQQEHGIEVQLPFLARLAPESKVVGITIGQGDLGSCRRFAQGLAEVIRGREDKPLLLISSDMNHFATDAENRRLDAMALAALEKCDPAELFHVVTRHNISMCGLLPAVIVLETLKLLGGWTKATKVGYATSADATGDTSRVVGYAGMLFG